MTKHPLMTIRIATERDLRAIQKIAHDAYEKYVERIGRRPAPMVADFQTPIAEGQVHVLEVEGEVVGFVVAYPRGDRMHLENVAVLPSTQGMGYGTQLMVFTEERARERGLKAVELYTNVKMTENVAYYPYLGYVETGRWEQDGFHRVFFCKQL